MRNPASTPLLSLDVVAFDSETTGLDTNKARMIELGAVRIVDGTIDTESQYRQLINPGIPIPADSQTIHGISDAAVANAPAFADIINTFDTWRGESILLGYATGFDLAMLKRERALADLSWESPRSLDVRFLVNLLSPTLPDFSLETIAHWLGIEVQGRHSALGDAVATAEIFIALIPRLRKLGIRTLAEAERACEQFDRATAMEYHIGWLDPHQGRSRKTVLARIDSFPYRHRLRELMNHPPLFIEPKTSLKQALNQMIAQQVSSLYVHAAETNDKPGIITERDILRRINQDPNQAFDLTAGEIASYPLASLSADAFVYRAIARMKRLHVRHLGIHDADGQIVGALSARDLLRQRADDAILLGDDIDCAESAAQMAAVWGNITLVAKSLDAEDVGARDIAAVTSRELCALTRQACILAEREMPTPSPCSYAMLVLGSGGRGESLLAMDQDNAIVFAEGEPGGAEDQWFAQLGSKVADMLDAAGVPYCKGNIMASNPDWRMSVSHWQEVLQTWIHRQTPEDILNCDIFFDAACVHGEHRLANAVLDQAFALGAESKQFIKLMSINACKNAPPLGLFGRFKLDNGRMDLKMGGIMPLFSAARVLAIQHRQRVHSTPARYQAALNQANQMHGTFEDLSEAHRIIFQAILQQQLLDLEAGIPLSNRVAPEALSAALRDQLAWALEQVPNVSNLLGDPLSSI